MPFSPKTLEEKPYNVCINCIHIGKRCDGPNFLAMSTERWCEWCKVRKEYLGLTNEQVAERAEVSLVSVGRVMSGHVKDLRISTMQRVTKALVNGSWGQYPCAMSDIAESETVYIDNPNLVERADRAEAECARLRVGMNDLHTEYRADLAASNLDNQRKIDFLKEQLKARDALLKDRNDVVRKKDRIAIFLSSVLAVFLLAGVAALIFALV